MGLRFKAAWRFEPPADGDWRNQTISPEALDDFHRLIIRTATQGPRQEILEHFKGFFCTVVGHTHVWSSDEGWADTDLRQYMGQAADNAPLFLEAFYDACDTITRVNEHYSAPSAEMINTICERHHIGYWLSPPNLILRETETLAAKGRLSAGIEAETLSHSVADISVSTPAQVKGRPLRAFLCHSSNDKAMVRDLYHRLRADGVEPWLDEEDLLPGQDWQQEIPKAVRNSDIVIVCLSQRAVNKRGYIQKEIKYALDVADEQPEGTIFIIPLKLEECDVPDRLTRLHWVNFFEDRGYEFLMNALRYRAKALAMLDVNSNKLCQIKSELPPRQPAARDTDQFDLKWMFSGGSWAATRKGKDWRCEDLTLSCFDNAVPTLLLADGAANANGIHAVNIVREIYEQWQNDFVPVGENEVEESLSMLIHNIHKRLLKMSYETGTAYETTLVVGAIYINKFTPFALLTRFGNSGYIVTYQEDRSEPVIKASSETKASPLSLGSRNLNPKQDFVKIPLNKEGILICNYISIEDLVMNSGNWSNEFNYIGNDDWSIAGFDIVVRKVPPAEASPARGKSNRNWT